MKQITYLTPHYNYQLFTPNMERLRRFQIA
jgi:hypothetical protein